VTAAQWCNFKIDGVIEENSLQEDSRRNFGQERLSPVQLVSKVNEAVNMMFLEAECRGDINEKAI
jgi:hypothetical protein